MKTALNYIFGILLIISLIAVGILSYQNYRYRTTPPEVISVHDTTIIKKDSIITKTLYKTKWDTIKDIHYKDTILHDTIYLEMEHKLDSFSVQKDSLRINGNIWHSGFKSSIDSVRLDYSFNYTVKPPKQKKIGFVWYVGIGPSGGVNFNLNNRTFDYGPSFGIQAGIGIGGYVK